MRNAMFVRDYTSACQISDHLKWLHRLGSNLNFDTTKNIKWKSTNIEKYKKRELQLGPTLVLMLCKPSGGIITGCQRKS